MCITCVSELVKQVFPFLSLPAASRSMVWWAFYRSKCSIVFASPLPVDACAHKITPNSNDEWEREMRKSVHTLNANKTIETGQKSSKWEHYNEMSDRTSFFFSHSFATFVHVLSFPIIFVDFFIHRYVLCAVCLALCAHSLRLYLLIFSFSFIRKTLLARFFLFSCCSSFGHIFLDVTAARLLFVTKHIQTSWSKCKIPCYRTDCCCCCLFSCMPCVRCFFMCFFLCCFSLVVFRFSCRWIDCWNAARVNVSKYAFGACTQDTPIFILCSFTCEKEMDTKIRIP